MTARAQEGFTLANAEWSYTLDLPAAETCELPNTGGKTPNTSLPQTGAQAAGIVGAGAAALLAGLTVALAGIAVAGEEVTIVVRARVANSASCRHRSPSSNRSLATADSFRLMASSSACSSSCRRAKAGGGAIECLHKE